MKYLLSRPGIDVNAKNKFGQTALILAAWKGHDRVVKALLDHGEVDLTIRDNNWWTALGLAEDEGWAECVKLLKNHKSK